MSNVTIVVPNSQHLDPVLPKVYAGGQVWHYTNTEGVLGILTDNAIRASSIRSLNDSAEFSYGATLISQEWSAKSDAYSNASEVSMLLHQAQARFRPADAFVVCASSKARSLSQWRAYGSYAIGINTEVSLQVQVDTGPKAELAQWTEARGELQKAVRAGWRPVVYDPEEQRLLADRLFDALNEIAPAHTGDGSEESRRSYLIAMDLYYSAIAYLKHEAFADEHEVRLFANYYSESPGVHFRPGRLGIVPFVHIETAQHLIKEEVDAPVNAAYKRFPLLKIEIGPGLIDPGAAESGLTSALKAFKFDIPVEVVESPFR
jgi:hypothetical protein